MTHTVDADLRSRLESVCPPLCEVYQRDMTELSTVGNGIRSNNNALAQGAIPIPFMTTPLPVA